MTIGTVPATPMMIITTSISSGLIVVLPKTLSMSSNRESSPITFPYPVASLITLGFRPQNILNPELLTLNEDEIGSLCPLLSHSLPPH